MQSKLNCCLKVVRRIFIRITNVGRLVKLTARSILQQLLDSCKILRHQHKMAKILAVELLLLANLLAVRFTRELETEGMISHIIHFL